MPGRSPPSSSGSARRVHSLCGALFVLVSAAPLYTQEPSAAAQSAVAGAQVFGEQGCGICHSVGGVGGSIGPDLREVSAGNDLYGLSASLWNHLPDMALRMDALGIDRPALSARETGDLLAYLHMVGGSAGRGSPEAGNELYRDAGCIRCHRVGSVGGVIGPALDRIPKLRTPHGLAAGLWNHSGEMIPRMRAMGIPYPNLTAADLSDLQAFLLAAAPEEGAMLDSEAWVLPGDPGRGQALVQREGCTSCHLIGGRGAGTAPELSNPGGNRSVESFYAALWNKGPSMRAAYSARGSEPPEFEPGEMADLSAYLQSLGYFTSAGDSRRGMSVVRSSGCLSCHGWGEEGRLAGDLRSIAPSAEIANGVAKLWNHLGVIDSTGFRREEWPLLERSEMIDLLEFLRAGSR